MPRSEGQVTGYYASVFYSDFGDGCASTSFEPIEVTDDMVQRALDDFYPNQGEVRGTRENMRAALTAALRQEQNQ